MQRFLYFLLPPSCYFGCSCVQGLLPGSIQSRSLTVTDSRRGMLLEAANIVDFSPRWDFPAGGANMLIVLAAPMEVEIGRAGPIVCFADHSVKVRCKLCSSRCLMYIRQVWCFLSSSCLRKSPRIAFRLISPDPIVSRVTRQRQL